MNLLFLSHCVPNPPDKGEKIRAFHSIHALARNHNVHLACFGRSCQELEDAKPLRNVCSSVYAEKLHGPEALLRGVTALATGRCLNAGYFQSGRMRRYVEKLCRAERIDAIVAYSVPMQQYAPRAIPIVLDMIDVDSEKWCEYARVRRPGFLYALEARRLRALERRCAREAAYTLLTTANEEALLRRISGAVQAGYFENGVDPGYYDGEVRQAPGLQGRQFIAFAGAMDYHPNIEAALWFAGRVLPKLRERVPGLEFFVVGSNPAKQLRRLSGRGGVVVTGRVPDIRPYLANARAVVAPLRLARGIQNKVLESLAMGRPVFVSPAVFATFGRETPPGVVLCADEQAYMEELTNACASPSEMIGAVRDAACQRFSWRRNIAVLERALEAAAGVRTGALSMGAR